MMIESLEHFAKAEATAGESSAVPFDELYCEGMTQTVFRVGRHAVELTARVAIRGRIYW